MHEDDIQLNLDIIKLLNNLRDAAQYRDAPIPKHVQGPERALQEAARTAAKEARESFMTLCTSGKTLASQALNSSTSEDRAERKIFRNILQRYSDSSALCKAETHTKPERVTPLINNLNSKEMKENIHALNKSKPSSLWSKFAAVALCTVGALSVAAGAALLVVAGISLGGSVVPGLGAIAAGLPLITEGLRRLSDQGLTNELQKDFSKKAGNAVEITPTAPQQEVSSSSSQRNSRIIANPHTLSKTATSSTVSTELSSNSTQDESNTRSFGKK